jgi:hypothetical protein
MNTISLLQVPLLTVGSGCLALCRKFLDEQGVKRVFLIAPPFGREIAEKLLAEIPHSMIESSIEV